MAKKKDAVCPTCGTCPTCGAAKPVEEIIRFVDRPYPVYQIPYYVPPPPVYPVPWTWPTITCGSGGATSIGSTSLGSFTNIDGGPFSAGVTLTALGTGAN